MHRLVDVRVVCGGCLAMLARMRLWLRLSLLILLRLVEALRHDVRVRARPVVVATARYALGG